VRVQEVLRLHKLPPLRGAQVLQPKA
jgi:hypothetical protein